MEFLAYRDRAAVVVEVPDVIDLDDRAAALAALCDEVDRCIDTLLIVRLLDPVVTMAALHVLTEAQQYARARRIALHVSVDPVAEHVFRIAGFDHLLAGRP